jgi:CelD/BcsL family acetyltransferase involved in cellulose biosynthesis
MTSEFTTHISRTVSESRDNASDWSDLYQRCSRATPFQSPEWVLAWAEAFSPECMRVIEVRCGGTLVGLAPLLIYRRAQEPVLAFMGGGVSDYLDLLVDPRFESEVFAAILGAVAEIDGWITLDWTDLPAASLLHRMSLARLAVPHDHCSSLRLPASRQRLLELLSDRQRANLRNARSRLQRAGGGTVELASAETLPEFLKDLFRLHTSRWLRMGESGVLADPKVRSFHCQAAPQLLARGILRFYRLRVNRQTVATLYALLGPDTVFCYLQGFDPEFAHLSPGTQLMFSAIEDAVHMGIDKFDFLRGDEAYKKHWRAQLEPTYRIQLPRSAIHHLSSPVERAA